MALPTLSRKLTVLLGAMTALALLLGGAASTALEYVSIQRGIVQELQAQAAVVGYSATMAMAFEDPLRTGVELANLKASPRVVRAALYTPQGKVYAVYPSDLDPTSLPPLPTAKGPTVRIHAGVVDVFSPNDVGDGVGSYIYLQGRTDEIRPRVVEARTQELTRTNAELLGAKLRAEEASRAKSDFLANMSHELRTPLNAVLLYSDLLRYEAQDRGLEALIPDIQTIHGAGKHLLTLIDGILDLASIEAGRSTLGVEWVELAGLVEAVKPVLQPQLDRQQDRLVVDLDPVLPAVLTDRKKLETILFNLLDNAAKFTRNGTVTVRAWREGDAVAIEVRDTGIGMRPDQVARIFQDFTQGEAYTTRRFGGLGLGLTLSQRLCRLLDARITVESREGEGSCFRLTLPIERPSRSPLLTFQPSYPAGAASARPPIVPTPGKVSQGLWITWSAHALEEGKGQEARPALHPLPMG